MSTHRVNFGQHGHNVSAQHLPGLPEDVAGEGVSPLSTWVGKSADEELGTAARPQ